MTPQFKLTLAPLLVLLIVACGAKTANAQEVTTSAAQSQAATGTATNVNQPIFNTANPGVTAGTLAQQIHTNQAASAAPAFGVQGYGCALPGSGVSLQVPGGGLSAAKAGPLDPGCTGPRDLGTMSIPGLAFTADDRMRRACAVPDIAAAAPDTCAKVLPRKTASATSADPYIAARMAAQ